MESPEVRRRTMQAVKSKDTCIEMHVRRLLHAQGYRYRLHRADLPGCPDLVFRSRRKVIFIHGCFWHGHQCARGKRVPKTNTDYWTAKISRNSARDAATRDRLKGLGWKASIVWECELAKHTGAVLRKLSRFLGPVESKSG
jgi:DNA mismatch endonuclease, patch repair protein